MGDIQNIDASLEEHQYTTPTGTGVDVATTSTLVLASDSSR